ncbi:MAG: NapC/NirT family cytochrome c [Motiliproteus sp.]
MGIFNRRSVQIAALLIGLGFVAIVIAFEPLTRNVIAVDAVCSYCHVDQEYRSEVRLAYSKAHPPLREETAQENGKAEPQAACAECHLAPGFINAVYAYSHFASLTDLFGHFRSRTSERAGTWLPPRQAAAYRVRDRLYEYNSPTCRNCHVEEEIEPKRERGINAHKKALGDKMTCIECHYNEKHRSVDLRENAFAQNAEH